jgi:leader peptidase (prepilin peptidase) / N-methyltransferase
MIAATSVALHLGGLAGGAVIGLLAAVLARRIPAQMDRESKSRSPSWWGAAVAVAVAFGWQAGTVAGGWALLPAYLAFGATTLAVTLTDIDHQLIPNRILFPGLGIAAALLVFGALLDGVAGNLVRALLASLLYFGFLLVVGLAARGGFGMGDVKLALLLGLFLGFVGWNALAVGFTLAILLGGIASVVVLVFTRKGRRGKFAYGPYLVAGAWIGLFWGPRIADWYLGTGT